MTGVVSNLLPLEKMGTGESKNEKMPHNFNVFSDFLIKI